MGVHVVSDKSKIVSALQSHFGRAVSLEEVDDFLSVFATNGLNIVETTPDPKCISSMALRYDHSFGIPAKSEEEIEEIRKHDPIGASMLKTPQHKEIILTSMRQLFEEVVGTGFFKK